jgi:hypothetical protein
MRSNAAFALLVAMAGVLGYFGVAWMSGRVPVPASAVAVVSVEPMKPSPGLPTFEESVQKGVRKSWTESKTSQGDNGRERDALRLELKQAANAYSLSPCSPIMKANLVKALTAYASAVAEKTGCGFMMCGDGARVSAGAEMFGTPMDKRAKEAAAEAFEKGGISVKDFPGDLRLTLLMVVGDQGDATPACGRTAERSERKRR